MKLKEFKTKFLQDWVQFILLDNKGNFIDSCHTLFELPMKGGNMMEQVAFLESINDILLELEVGKELSFPCINFDLFGYNGFFDFVFYKINYNGQKCILWIIMNFSDHYKHLVDLQQQRNESVIQKELIEVEKRNALLAKELLEFKNDELKRTQKLKTDFFSKVSHEIRTPINGILGMSELLLDDPAPDQIRSYANTIYQASKHLTTIINDVLDLSKIESNKVTIEKVSFNIREIINSVTSSFVYLGKEKGIKVITNIANNVPSILIGDQVKLSQILYNLLSNALKFTDAGQVLLNLKIHSSHDHECRIEFEVKDSGIGIPNDKLEKVFEAYEQVAEHTSRIYGGTGLGLHIVRQLVELQNGNIEVKSEKDNGTTFVFDLPFGISYNVETKTDPTYENINPHLNILIGEDNPLNQKILHELLKKWGFQSCVVDNGKLIIEELNKAKFDLIILDYKMPELDGLKTLQFIRDNFNKEINKVPVIFFTGERQPAILDNFKQLGAEAILTKPIEPKVLLMTIQNIFVRREPAVNFNLNYAVEMTSGNKRLVYEMIEIFVNSMPEELNKLKSLIERQEIESMKKVIHKIKPNFHYMGLVTAKKDLDALQNQLDTDPDWKRMMSDFLKLQKIVLNAVDALRHEKNNWEG